MIGVSCLDAIRFGGSLLRFTNLLDLFPEVIRLRTYGCIRLSHSAWPSFQTGLATHHATNNVEEPKIDKGLNNNNESVESERRERCKGLHPDLPEWLESHTSIQEQRKKKRFKIIKNYDIEKSLTFADLGTHKILVEGLKEYGIVEPSDIQQRAIPLITQGKDCILSSPTGTGKTLSYILPLIQRVYEFHDAINSSRNNEQCFDNPLSLIRPWVILAVRRDLCAQVIYLINYSLTILIFLINYSLTILILDY